MCQPGTKPLTTCNLTEYGKLTNPISTHYVPGSEDISVSTGIKFLYTFRRRQPVSHAYILLLTRETPLITSLSIDFTFLNF